MRLLHRVGGLLILPALALMGATKISDVDFRNFDFPWEVRKISVPAEWKWLEGAPRSHVALKGGRHEFSPANGYLILRSVTYGDLDRDGRDEAAVDLLFGTGGTATWHYLYVFTLANGRPALLARLQSGSRADGGLVKVAIRDNKLVLDFEDINRRLADCCSERFIRVTYRWQAGRFVEVGTRTSGDLNLVK